MRKTPATGRRRLVDSMARKSRASKTANSSQSSAGHSLRKGLFSLVTSAALLTSSGAALAQTKPQVLEFKFADVQPAQGIYAKYEQKFVKLIEEGTNGAVKIAVFAGGALGGEKDVLEGMRVGSVHISLIGLTL